MHRVKKSIWDLHRPDVCTALNRDRLPLTVVLDNVRSLNNIGSIFRTADAFMVERIVLCGISATPPSPEIHKTALGAEDTVPWLYAADTVEAVKTLRNQGYRICVLEQVHDSVDLRDFVPEPGVRYALVSGHEVDGVSSAVVDLADCCIEIPQTGVKHSLNVSVSTGIALWKFFESLVSKT